MLFLVNRMKDLKSRLIAGDKLPRRNRSKLVLGIKKLDRVYALKLLSLMYRWKAKTPTRGTYAKFVRSINRGRSDKHVFSPPGYFFTKDELEEFKTFLPSIRVDYAPLEVEGAHVMEGGEVADGPQHIADELYAMCESGDIFIHHLDYLEKIFDLTPILSERLKLVAISKQESGPFVGKIAGLTKDGGLKVRHVANLIKGWQVAISPLVKFYKMIEETYPQSANWNQLEGAVKAACAAEKGIALSSFDVVSSTDNIYRKLFFILMDPVIESLPDSKEGKLVKSAYAVDKELCSEGVYLTPFNQRAWYDIGQAMGRWTSKSQLNLTMIKLSASCGGNSNNSAINGDDVIIWNDLVSQDFEVLLEKLDIPISIEKSYIRKKAGEFSGKIITSEDGILPVVKGSKENLESDPFGSLRQYGRRGLSLYGKTLGMVKRVAKYLGGKQLDVQPYLDETKADEGVSKAEKDFIASIDKTPTLEKGSTSKRMVDQVFFNDDELYKEYKAVQFSMDYDPDMFNQPSLYGQYKQRESELRERIRRLHDFRHVAVKRFSPPISRLDTLIDNLKSHHVTTSDGHRINGFGHGETAHVYERLFQNIPPLFEGKSRDQDNHRLKKARIRQLHRLNRLIKRWEKELKAPILVETKRPSLLVRFFEYIVYGVRN
jgi:hypothetical protein